jgi:Phosphotransferase enzyme family
MKWVSENTDIPVSKVFDFDDTNANAIGFEWILMELMPGVSVWSKWRGLPMTQKVFLTQRIAELQAQLFRHKFPAASFRRIGALSTATEQSNPAFGPGHMVTGMFFKGTNLECDLPRGPFRSSHDWLKAYLGFVARAMETVQDAAGDENDKEEAENVSQVARRLLALLPRISPSIQDPPE